jgi:hypothetical protein
MNSRFFLPKESKINRFALSLPDLFYPSLKSILFSFPSMRQKSSTSMMRGLRMNTFPRILERNFSKNSCTTNRR